MVGGDELQEVEVQPGQPGPPERGERLQDVHLTAVGEGIPPRAFSSASPITIPDCGGRGVPWRVGNAEPGTGGAMSLWEGTKFSVNVVFAQLVNEVGPRKVAEVAHRES